jgi:hypothetical protein
METESPGVFHKAKVEAHLALLREASEYFGIEKGRAPEYSQLLEEFYDQNKRTPQHLLAYSESCEITDIYSFWKGMIEEFPGLKEKVREALSKGSVLRETEEIKASSNHARNLAFTYYLAGTLLSANLTVVVVMELCEKAHRHMPTQTLRLSGTERSLISSAKGRNENPQLPEI